MGIARARKIAFENFRNLGVYGSKKSETRLDLGVIGTGGLICLIGANNEGKKLYHNIKYYIRKFCPEFLES